MTIFFLQLIQTQQLRSCYFIGGSSITNFISIIAFPNDFRRTFKLLSGFFDKTRTLLDRLAFLGGNDCNMEEEKGQLMWDVSPDDVPIEASSFETINYMI